MNINKLLTETGYHRRTSITWFLARTCYKIHTAYLVSEKLTPR